MEPTTQKLHHYASEDSKGIQFFPKAPEKTLFTSSHATNASGFYFFRYAVDAECYQRLE